jgi:5-methylthioadenosine/S-adenosylhomocysteine deaminase
VATGDTLYPGMIELHNHLAYNAVPLWRVPKRYQHNGSGSRSLWTRRFGLWPTATSGTYA